MVGPNRGRRGVEKRKEVEGSAQAKGQMGSGQLVAGFQDGDDDADDDEGQSRQEVSEEDRSPVEQGEPLGLDGAGEDLGPAVPVGPGDLIGQRSPDREVENVRVEGLAMGYRLARNAEDPVHRAQAGLGAAPGLGKLIVDLLAVQDRESREGAIDPRDGDQQHDEGIADEGGAEQRGQEAEVAQGREKSSSKGLGVRHAGDPFPVGGLRCPGDGCEAGV
ncbi:hypothetical protein D3C87_1348670 [compost metagenome]